ncbi:rhodanese-like domain-containing protein [Bdellovibrio bacteriovorus]|uniref:Rhodanese domain-containing protein n=1 Tax=Bdellovibrio bacteriovorus str. Tiberius TaxID=1069642 RepID=K7YRE5_BDEBC|nr:rhodanese-like domain-containing protein [Bdellovibrio bacteriovorus]AFY00158.1 hypothetical protein Bdt_0450 [Bdellovibrio bacteriovorus str. Tiberius]
MDFNSIGYFQFDNLIQTRTPFLLVILDNVDLNDWYKSVTKMHLDNISLPSTPEGALEAVKGKSLPPHFAVVVLDRDEKSAPQVAAMLEQAGFINSFYVKGGLEGLLKERQQ